MPLLRSHGYASVAEVFWECLRQSGSWSYIGSRRQIRSWQRAFCLRNPARTGRERAASLRDAALDLEVRADKLRMLLPVGSLGRYDHRAIGPGGVVGCYGSETGAALQGRAGKPCFDHHLGGQRRPESAYLVLTSSTAYLRMPSLRYRASKRCICRTLTASTAAPTPHPADRPQPQSTLQSSATPEHSSSPSPCLSDISTWQRSDISTWALHLLLAPERNVLTRAG